MFQPLVLKYHQQVVETVLSGDEDIKVNRHVVRTVHCPAKA